MTTLITDGPSAARLYEVRRRRVFAFLVDLLIILFFTAIASVVVFFLGIITLTLAWLLYGGIFPTVAVLYTGMTIDSRQSTIGMRMFDLVLRTESGRPLGFIFGAAHIILFYISVTVLTPLVLLISLLNGRKRLLHDIVMGVTVERAS